MSGVQAALELGSWAVEGNPSIEYSLAVVDRIRAESVDGLNRFRHGGVEVGGVLFGRREGGRLRILAARSVPCEHASGPSFTLSPSDELLFRQLLRTGDPELSGLEPLGWYHSHTRSGLVLSAEDLAVHRRLFPKAGQIAVVLRPETFGGARVGIFFPPSDLPAAEYDAAPLAQRKAAAPEPEAPPPMPAPAPRVELPIEERGSSPARTKVHPLIWIAAAAVILLALFFFRPAPPAPQLGLLVRGEGEQLDIRWNGASPAIREARSGVLTIQEADGRKRLEFDAERLRAGQVYYVRHSEIVDVDFEVTSHDGRPIRQFARFVGSLPPEPVLPPETVPVTHELLPTLPAGEAQPRPAPPRALRYFQPPVERRAPVGKQALSTPPAISPAAAAARPWSAPEQLPPPPPPAPKQPPQPAKPVYQGPLSGRIIWTGQMRRDWPLSIMGNKASYGVVTGELPGVPVRIAAHPAELSSRGLTIYTNSQSAPRAEAPSAANGWNATAYSWDPKEAARVLVTEVPSSQNSWKGVTVRGESERIAVVVIDWRVVSPQSSDAEATRRLQNRP